MNKNVILIVCLLFLKAHQLYSQNTSLHKIVNPFIGTGGHGHTFPGPTMPFGACQLSPDTRLEGWDGCSGYHYSDSIIYGFSHTHLSGTGCSDYGDILLMPVNKEMRLDKYQYASHFSHKNEKAHAGFYEVFLDDPKVNVSLTTTLHGGVHQYRFQKEDDMYVVLDLKHRDELLDSKMEQVDDYTIRGYRFSKAWAQNQKVFYEIQFSRKIESIQYEQKKVGSNTVAIDVQKSYQCIIKFERNTKSPNPANANYLTVKCAISGVDEEGAHKNLVTEMTHWDFEKYKQQCEDAWQKELSKIIIKDKDKNKMIIFYTALYHCMIHPSLYNDVDGRYRGRDDKIYSTEGKFDYYTVFSLWDTYRALHPLLTWIDKKRTNDFINTFIKQYEQVGRMPIWELSSNETNCMIGYHVVSVIWDAYNRGIRNYDVQKAFEAMKSIATHYTHYEGEGLKMKLKEEYIKYAADADALESYCKYGYVRSDDSHESVSKTLEYAYNDWCIAQMAKALNDKESYNYYTKRSHHWMNVYDPTTGFMRARKNGCLYEPFSPYTVDNNYTEANSWQYSFYVPHNIEGLIKLSGGIDSFEKKLDAIFHAREKTEGREQSDITGLIGQYAHGNEPSHHIAYLYDYIGEFEKSRTIRKKIVDSFYKNDPDGLIGNEDCGQMSAWYVLNALGWYMICPGTNGTFNDFKMSKNPSLCVIPLFDSAFVYENNKLAYRITQPDKITSNTHAYFYMSSDEKYTDKNAIRGPHYIQTTNKNSWYDANKLHIGLSAVNPFIKATQTLFKDTMTVEIKCANTKSSIYYSVNNEAEKKYTKPISIIDNATIEYYARDYNNTSYIQTANFKKIPNDRKITLKSEYNKSYHAGGAQGLIDGIYGKLNWRAGDWQGYQGQDVEVIMEFNEAQNIKSLAANFLEDQNSWIFYPKQVNFYVSKNGNDWTLVNEIETNKSDKDMNVSITKFETSYSTIVPEKYKFAKMIAKNFGPMPQWHEGRGNPTFIFIDEFEVK